MFVAALASLIIDQLVIFYLLRISPEHVVEASRWFGVLAQPWSSLLALVLVALLGLYSRSFWLGIVLGAALSNLITFLVRGHAVDYLTLPGGVVTNLADILITVGLFLWAIYGFKKQKRPV